MKRRNVVALLTAFAMAVSLTACAGGGSAPQATAAGAADSKTEAAPNPAGSGTETAGGQTADPAGGPDSQTGGGDQTANPAGTMAAEDFGNVWDLIDQQDISGFKVGLMSSSVAQGEETYRMAMRMQDRFGDRLIVDTFPEKAVSEQETTISKVMAMASDPQVKAIVFNQAQDGTIAAIKKLKEVREDVLTIACNPNEDYDEIATVADFVLCKDQFGFAEQVADMAIDMGARNFVHYSFPRHMSNQNIAKRCEMMKEICEGAGIRFLEVTAPDPQGDAGTAGTQQFILEDVPRQLKSLGEDTVFFSTNTAMHSPIVKCVMEGHGMYCGQSDPTPFADFPSALGLEVPEDKIGDSDYMLAEIQKKIDELGMNGRVSTWPTSLNMMYTQIGIMYAMLYSTGVVDSVEGEDAMGDRYILQMENIEKEYYGNRVLKGISLNLRPGEIMALVGENGAGKSTLMNVLFGMEQIRTTGGFKGRVIFDGEETRITSPREAMEKGIGMVHQEFMLLPGFTITENIKLNREILKPSLLARIFGKRLSGLDHRAMGADARKSLDRIGLELPETMTVDGLPVGFMQFVEIAREIDKTGMKLIVFDEPTAVLTEIEAGKLLDTIRMIARQGVAVIFISHKLDEIMEVADTVMVMRDGENVCTLDKADTSVRHLAELMVGRGVDAGSIPAKRSFDDRDMILSIRNLRVEMPGEEVKGFSLDVRRGEIVGLGGLAGQGKIGVSNGVLGLYPSEGEILFKGEPLPMNQPLGVLKKRIAFVSEDRKNVGLILGASIEENIGVGALRVNDRFLKKTGPFTQIDTKARREHARQMVQDFQIKCVSTRQKVGDLSGGNQQKVCMAKALTMEPELLFVSEPTRGIDIGAKQVLLDYLVKLNREQGMTIVMTSSELKELRSVCDRIAIVTGGKLEGILEPDSSDVEFGLMMSGTRAETEGQMPGKGGAGNEP